MILENTDIFREKEHQLFKMLHIKNTCKCIDTDINKRVRKMQKLVKHILKVLVIFYNFAIFSDVQFYTSEIISK